jgi:NitT/TauT family transport system substrate-binding protein
MLKLLRIALVAGALLSAGSSSLWAQKTTLRVGHFPNITHAQALVASQLKRQGKGWFEERLGPDVELQWYIYNAGAVRDGGDLYERDRSHLRGAEPGAECLLQDEGRRGARDRRCGDWRGALVVQGDGRLSKPQDFRGKKIATPQLGNTQDVAARAWLKKQGYRITQLTGEVTVLPTPNPDQLPLFQRGDIDGAWTVEPWVSRLELEANGKIFLEEKEALTTVLASSVKLLKERPELVKKFAAAHAELTKWIQENPAEARELVRAELKELTKREFAAATAERAWPRLKFTSEITRAPFDALVVEAQSVGFLRGATDLARLVEIPK